MSARAEAPRSRCPRCGGGFHCGVGDATPCACCGVSLGLALQARLRERYRGCLCLRCLQALAGGAAIESPAADGPRSLGR